MKRLFISVLALASLVACNKNEVLDVVSPDAITFEGAWVDNATRSEDPSYVNDPNASTALNEFDVYGFMTSVEGVVFNQEKVWRTNANQWTYANTQYWTPNKDYYFAAIAPASGYSLEANTANLKGLGKVTFVQPVENPGSVDLIYSAVKVTSPANVTTVKPEPVKLIFSHLLSKVKFSFKNGFTNENAYVKITKIKMTVPAKGTIDLAVENWWDDKDDWNLEADNTTTLDFGDMENDKLAINQTTESEKERLTFPTPADQEYFVEFDAELFYGSESAYTSHLTTTITGAQLMMGKAYNFSAVITPENIAPGNEQLYPIEFTVEEIKDWEDGNGYEGGEIVTGPFKVSNEAELAAAINAINNDENIVNSGAIQLENDITLSTAVKSTTPMYCLEITKNVVFDLNGKTITGGLFTYDNGNVVASDNNTDSYVFWVKQGGKLTINDGVGGGIVKTQSCDYSIAVWADGGEVTINAGTYENAGEGSDLIYAKNGGNIIINGGVFTANKNTTSNGTKNEYTALNLGDNTGANITVYGGKFYGFDPANNFSEGENTNFVAPGYMSLESESDNSNYSKVYTVVPQKFEVGNEAELIAAVEAAVEANNPVITLTNDITVSKTVEVNATGLTLNLNGYKLNNKVENENESNDVIIVRENGELTIKGKGTVEAVSGNDGYAIISEGTLTIEEGTYRSGLDANNDGNCTIYARGNGKVYIKGGDFSTPEGDDSTFVVNKRDADRATTTIEISGGSFKNYNPALGITENPVQVFVKTGYNVVKNGNVYTVLAPSCTLAEDAAAVTIFKATNLNGNGKTLSIDEVGSQFLVSNTLRLIQASAGTIQNLNIDGKNAKFGQDSNGNPYGIRGIFLVGAGSYVIENVNIKDVTYPLNDDSAAKTLTVKNSVLEGWTSYNSATTATFENVKFQVNVDAYGAFRPQGNTTLVNCDFADGFAFWFDKMDTDKTLTFKNCTYNGVVLTAENIASIWTSESNGYAVAKCKVVFE